jgi:hypothetical protein
MEGFFVFCLAVRGWRVFLFWSSMIMDTHCMCGFLCHFWLCYPYPPWLSGCHVAARTRIGFIRQLGYSSARTKDSIILVKMFGNLSLADRGLCSLLLW